MRDIETEAFFTVSQQTSLFLLSVLMGAVMGVLYDVFRAVRAAFPFMRKTIPTVVCDILFMLIAGLTVYIFSLLFAGGEVRGYYWLGSALGMVIYLMTVGTVVIGIIRWVSELIYRIIRRLWVFFTKPFAKLLRKNTTKKGYNFVSIAKKMFPNCKKLKKDLQKIP